MENFKTPRIVEPEGVNINSADALIERLSTVEVLTKDDKDEIAKMLKILTEEQEYLRDGDLTAHPDIGAAITRLITIRDKK